MNQKILDDEARVLCSNPIDWRNINDEFEDEFEDVVRLLNLEWFRVFSQFCVDEIELGIVKDIIFNDFSLGEVELNTLINLRDRRPLAEKEYMAGAGVLSEIEFRSPSEDGKHFSASGPRAESKNISYFYHDISSEDLCFIFWHWFSHIMIFDVDTNPRKWSFNFLIPKARFLWKKFVVGGENFRVALNTVETIGEKNGKQLCHMAFDIALGSGKIVHAYPITEDEAKTIMADLPVIAVNIRNVTKHYPKK